MRELKVIGLEADGKRVICQDSGGTEKFAIEADDKLRAAARGDLSRLGQIQIEMESALRPREIQARIRAGATVEQVAAAAGVDAARVQRFAHPVLLERQRAAELATAAHPVCADGPAVSTLGDTIASAMASRNLDPEALEWDAWKAEDARWTVQLQWRAGRSDNRARFRFTPGAHGGSVTALDDSARELIDPTFTRSLRPVAPVTPLPEPEAFQPELTPAPAPSPTPAVPETVTQNTQDTQVADTAVDAGADTAVQNADTAPLATPRRSRRNKPPVPAWEDVLLGVRSGSQG